MRHASSRRFAGFALGALILAGAEASAATMEVTVRSLNNRSGPSTRFRVLRVIHRGERYRVLDQRGNWYRLDVNGGAGWSYGGRYLRSVPDAGAPAPAPPPTPAAPAPVPAGPSDVQLAQLQRSALDVARAELARGVIETPYGANRGPRVDMYARNAGMRSGLPWCAFFANYCYTAAAQAAGRPWAPRRRFHSVGKVRAFFLYYDYTQRATAANRARWEATRQAHRAAGSMRRYMTLRGSVGDRAAGSRPHEVYDNYRALPLRPGDVVLWSRGGGTGHVGLVERYDAASGRLTTIEGNTSHRVRRKHYELSSATQRSRIDGFGRPSLRDLSN